MIERLLQEAKEIVKRVEQTPLRGHGDCPPGLDPRRDAAENKMGELLQ